MKTVPSRDYRPMRTRSRSMVLLVLGVLLLTPPFATIFHVDDKLFDVPVTLIYVFVVWALLISGAVVLARPLQAVAEEEERS